MSLSSPSCVVMLALPYSLQTQACRICEVQARGQGSRAREMLK